jgi:hypothetical protein
MPIPSLENLLKTCWLLTRPEPLPAPQLARLARCSWSNPVTGMIQTSPCLRITISITMTFLVGRRWHRQPVFPVILNYWTFLYWCRSIPCTCRSWGFKSFIVIPNAGMLFRSHGCHPVRTDVIPNAVRDPCWDGHFLPIREIQGDCPRDPSFHSG